MMRGLFLKWPSLAGLRVCSALALLVCLAAGGAQAADKGSRHHARGQYDTVTATYGVVEGDELAVISERFEVPVDTLKEQNKLASDEIRPGQKLAIAASTGKLEGTVMVAGQPVRGATVTLWRTNGSSAPASVAEASTGANGDFMVADFPLLARDQVFYLTTRGGARNALALMSVLGTEPPDKVVVNELTTVASAFTSARFIDGTVIRGNPLGLRIAAGNAPNLVDPATGTWGKVLLDPLNSTQTTTLANLNTLGSLISAYATVANDDWRARFLRASTPPSGVTPKNTLEAMAGIARAPWAAPKDL